MSPVNTDVPFVDVPLEPIEPDTAKLVSVPKVPGELNTASPVALILRTSAALLAWNKIFLL